jgi:hypothetical protein
MQMDKFASSNDAQRGEADQVTVGFHVDQVRFIQY